MTESAYFSAQAQKDCFQELGISQYEIVATHDASTSSICQEMDGKVFDASAFECGVTAPPFHPWCRSVTAPFFGEEFEKKLDGRGASALPNDMGFEDWKKRFAEGANAPDSFDNSSMMKYNNGTDWNAPREKIEGYSLDGSKKVKKLNEWLADDKELLDEVTKWYNEEPKWWGIDPENTDVFYRTPQDVKEIRKKPGESGGHHPHGLALGGPEGQKLTPTGESAKIKNPTHSQVTGLQRRVINRIKKQSN